MDAHQEHSGSDGFNLRVLEGEDVEGYNELLKTRDFVADHLPNPSHLKFLVNKKVKESILLARERAKSLCASVEVRTLRFDDYGSKFISKLNFPADSWAQIAIQLSYFRVHKSLTAVYETGEPEKLF